MAGLRLRRSNTPGSVPASLLDGELAINTADGKLYALVAGQVVIIGDMSFIEEAPADGKRYARQDNGWAEVAASGGGGGALTLLASEAIPASVSEYILPITFTADYSLYRIVILNLAPASTSNTHIELYASDDGSNWFTGAYDYGYGLNHIVSTGTYYNATNKIKFTSNALSKSGVLCTDITVYEPAALNYTRLAAQTIHQDNSGNQKATLVHGVVKKTTGISQLKLVTTHAPFAGGIVKVYGMA